MSEQPTIRKVHLVFKTHLDVGFTDFARNVVRDYRERFIPQAIQTAAALRQFTADNPKHTPRRFVWTTGSWLIYDYLESAGADERNALEAAILAGDIAWHALPFTTHTELMSADLFRYGLSLSSRLDERFGRKTIAGKMTDVPGHTRAMVPLLAEAGVQFVHFGVNGASTPPDVPDVFVWRDAESGESVLVMYHKGTYGDLKIVPGLDEAICFAHTNDNAGPQTPADALHNFDELQRQFPDAEIVGSTLDAFAVRLATIKDRLPVLTSEIGDTWIHGVGSDPLKVSQFLTLQRLHGEWIADGTAAKPEHRSGVDAFSRLLMMVPEHTWGMDTKMHLSDFATYRQPEFTAARQQPNFQVMEQSWDEQRGYLRDAVASLPDALRQQAATRLHTVEPRRPEPQQEGFTPLELDSLPHQMFTAGQFEIRLDASRGGLTHLKHVPSRRVLAGSSADEALGLFWFETFSQDDYTAFHRDYNINKETTSYWAIPDFTKPGMDAAAHRRWYGRLTHAYHRHVAGQDEFSLMLSMPTEAVNDYGAPADVALSLRFPADAPAVHFDLQWYGKPASRLAQAAWFSFRPHSESDAEWRLQKLGRWVDLRDVARDGNRHLHGAESVQFDAQLHLTSWDAPLVAPGKPSLLDFNNDLPALKDGVHVNLYNNVWGTNFRMWYDDDARFRFTLAFRPA
jgi:hypothetical protein